MNLGRRVTGQNPVGGLGVDFVSTAFAGDQFRDPEPGMPFEQLNKTLADGSCRAQNSYINRFHSVYSLCIQNKKARGW